jgi:Rps23 Pro-64 3,4-dihydroxylase Tpa1-like proline 4-hydroxylase
MNIGCEEQTLQAPLVRRPLQDPDLQNAFRDLAERAGDLASAYQNGRPYPFIVLDDFLPADLAEEMLAEFPPTNSEIWHRNRMADQFNKLTLSKENLLPPSIRSLVHELNSGSFLEILEKITGIANLIPDPKLVGGGLHQIDRSGRLNVHVDYSHHPENRLNRRLNLILYLNKSWPEEYGGHFEIWDRNLRRCEHRIAPLFNRCVIFSTTSYSYHGHPEPLTCPEGVGRKSIALYYYSNGRPEEPGPIVEHNTLFRLRPGDRFSVGTYLVRTASSGWIRDLMPPLFYRWLRTVWNRRLRKPTA